MLIGLTDIGIVLTTSERKYNLEEEIPDYDMIIDNNISIYDLDFDINDILVSTAHGQRRTDVSSNHLSKIWKIDLATIRKTLVITS